VAALALAGVRADEQTVRANRAAEGVVADFADAAGAQLQMRATVVGGVGLERLEGEIQIEPLEVQSATAERGLIGAKAVVDELDRDIIAARAAANGVRLAQLRRPKNNPNINQQLSPLSNSVWHYAALLVGYKSRSGRKWRRRMAPGWLSSASAA